MRPDSSDFAGLANDAYSARTPGVRGNGQREPAILNGHTYEVVEHVDRTSSGYQGTIYKRVDTQDFYVAHRGTEPVGRDATTDAAMVAARINYQARDAIELTGRAIEYAQAESRRFGTSPDVMVTGHSLGGTLAQISAHHFDLEGETFNAFGASSLSRRIPEGGSSVVNHVMAADLVSAASPHYGEVRVYASQREIVAIAASGHGPLSVDGVVAKYPLVGGLASLNSHSMSNFLGIESVLEDRQYRQRAEANQELIGEFRDSVSTRRAGLSWAVSLATGSGLSIAKDLYEEFRGPLPPGEPARREQEKAREVPPLPEGPLKPLNGPGHVGHPLFIGALRGVHELDQQAGRVPDLQSEQLAGALACRMHELGGKCIDHVVMSKDAATTFAVQGQLSDPAHLRVSVPTVAAMNTPLEQSGREIESQALAQSAQQDQAQEQVRSAGRTMIG